MRSTPLTDTNLTGTDKGENVKAVDRRRNVFGTEGNATEFFAAKSYRPHQKETIEEIESAFEQGYKYVILDAPTGAGKSYVGAAFAFQSTDAHIITIQKMLQDQYHHDFPDMAIMKGRSSYACLKSESHETCADGPCRLRRIEASPSCPYKLAKEDAFNAEVVVHNFDSFYYQNSFGQGFPGAKILIVDEAHNISNKFSNFLSFTIDSRVGIPVPDLDNLSEYDTFIKAAYKELSSELGILEQQYEYDALTKEGMKRMNDLSSTTSKMRRYISEREAGTPEEYVFDYVEYGRNSPKVTFRPVFVGKFASRWLANYGEKVLMMSATILDKDMFCREVGLNPEETYYVQVPSIFPPEHRPIIKKYAGPMNYKRIGMTLPRLAEIVQEIMDKYPNRKGIIQTHSEKIAKYLQSHLYDTRLTFNKDFPTPQHMLETHRRKEGSFIVASGLREGLDLRGELSKVQIFCKVPYPSLGDKLVARKMALDPNWYGWMTALMLVQGLGRSVRSPKERAVTFILDEGFTKFYQRYKKFIPQYVKEAFK